MGKPRQRVNMNNPGPQPRVRNAPTITQPRRGVIKNYCKHIIFNTFGVEILVVMLMPRAVGPGLFTFGTGRCLREIGNESNPAMVHDSGIILIRDGFPKLDKRI